MTTETQAARILKLLKYKGEATNYELARICLRYSARIHDLRREGHNIVPVHEKGSLWRFVYKGTREVKPELPRPDEVDSLFASVISPPRPPRKPNGQTSLAL